MSGIPVWRRKAVGFPRLKSSAIRAARLWIHASLITGQKEERIPKQNKQNPTLHSPHILRPKKTPKTKEAQIKTEPHSVPKGKFNLTHLYKTFPKSSTEQRFLRPVPGIDYL